MNNDFTRIIREIAEELMPKEASPSSISVKRKFLREAFDPDSEEINWLQLCEVAKNNRATRFAFVFLVRALERGLSFGEYTDFLLENLSNYKQLLTCQSLKYQTILCGQDIPYQVICPIYFQKNAFSYYFIKTDNRLLIKIVREYFEDSLAYQHGNYNQCLYFFGQSFGEKEYFIKSLNDIKCEMIYIQAEFYRNIFAEDARNLKFAVQFLCYFYRWLVGKYVEHDFFANSTRITRTLLFSFRFIEKLKEGYYFTNFNSSDIPLDHSKIVYITLGWDRISTKYTSEGSFSIDLTPLNSQKYRELILRYLVSASSTFSVIKHIKPLLIGLDVISKIKNSPDYSNPDISFLTVEDACIIRSSIDQGYSSATKTNSLSQFKRFFEWCEREGYIRLEPTFLESFYARDPQSQSTAETVPNNDLILLNDYLRKQCGQSLKDKITYAIFHLLLQTEFRLSQICHLKCKAIKSTLKPNEHVIQSISKTSHGDEEKVGITETTFRILNDIIQETDFLRDNKKDEKTNEYIFLYEYGIPAASTKVYSSNDFNNLLKKACAQIGIKPYSASNLRDTHMTNAWKFITKSGRSDIDLSLLTKHKQFDTTIKHYLGLELDKMLEATFEVEIGNIKIDTENKIVDSVPSELLGKENDVEGGCGKCSAKKCDGSAVLSCLICKNFVTTPDHEPYFRKALELIQQQILNSNCKHEKDDLTTIKTLYAEYLKAIYLHQEKTNGNKSI